MSRIAGWFGFRRRRLAVDLVSSSTRERWLWLGAALCLLVIYASAFVARPMTNFLRQHHLLRLTVGALFIVAGVLAVRWILRLRPAGKTLMVLSAVAGVGLLLLYWLYRSSVPEECVHLLEYGLLGGLIYTALVERQSKRDAGSADRGRPWLPGVKAILATALLGWVDEAIQFWLPERYYDVRDVALNAAAGLLTVLALEAVRRAQASATRCRPGGPGPAGR